MSSSEKKSFVLKGSICHNKDRRTFETIENGCLVCLEGVSGGAYATLPSEFESLSVVDCGDCVILPGLTDLHVHAPQFSFRSLGMDLELLDWLNTRTFPEEAKYADLAYAEKAYSAFVEDLKKGPNTRAVIFATRHVPATTMLMDMLEDSGLVAMVGKVNMDRNSPPSLQEESAERSIADTVAWLDACAGKYENVAPVLTPRFIPSCTDELLAGLQDIQRRYGLPVQSHLSENKGEISWVRRLCPESKFYADAYDRFGLFGGDAPAVMAHCVWSGEEETALMLKNGVYVAHCPQSNTNLSSGIAPIRAYVERGLKVGLGSDVAGGHDTSVFRVMKDAISVSKLRWRLVNQADRPLTVPEVFYLGTVGGGSFFGQTGNFAPGYEFDALVIDDGNLKAPFGLSIEERVTRIVYYADDRNIRAKYVRGVPVRLDGMI